MINRISDKLLDIGNIISVIFFGVVLAVSFIQMIKRSVLSLILFFVLIVIMFFIQKKKLNDSSSFLKYKDIINAKKNLVWIIIQLISSILSIVFISNIQITHSWDWGFILDNIYYYLNTGKIVDLEYFARYPNNQAWLFILVEFFKVFRFLNIEITVDFIDTVCIILSFLFTQITVLLIYLTSRKIFKSEIKSLFVGFFAVCAIPFHMYAMFAYTDTVSMMLGIFIIYIFECLKTEKRRFYRIFELIAISFAAALIFKIKILAFIVVIAIIINAFFTVKNKKRVISLTVAVLVLFAGFNSVISLAVSNEFGITDEMIDEYKFPPTHWVMMGLKNSGSYDQDDVNFSINAGNYDEKKDAEIKVIKERISEMKVGGLLKHLINKKMPRVWGAVYFAANDYSTRNFSDKSSLYFRMFSPYEGDLYRIPNTYGWLYFFLMVAGMFLESLFVIKNKKEMNKCLIFRYAVLGVGLFMLIWECNSRYLFTFLPLMIILSFKGWDLFNKEISAMINRKS